MMRSLIAFLFVASFAFSGSNTFPESWFIQSSSPGVYHLSSDTSTSYSDSTCAVIWSSGVNDEYAMVGQGIVCGDFQGKRVRFTAYLKTENIAQWAGVWLRGDRKDGAVVAFDNMESRGQSGTSDWKQYAVVLDIPRDAAELAYGVVLVGPGRVWIDEAAVEAVDDSVAVTAPPPVASPKPRMKRSHVKAGPENLGFELWHAY